MNSSTPCDLINKLNLTDIKKMMKAEMEYKNLSPVDLNDVEDLYKKFLYIMKKFPEEKFIPIRLVDEMWHIHILFTKKYRNDCQIIFKKFIDHTPFFDPHSKQVKYLKENTLKRIKEIFPEII